MKVQNTESGIGLAGWLGLLLIGLKLTHHITWAWLWVLSPFWIPLAAILGVLAVIGFVYGVCTIGIWLTKTLPRKRRRKKAIAARRNLPAKRRRL